MQLYDAVKKYGYITIADVDWDIEIDFFFNDEQEEDDFPGHTKCLAEIAKRTKVESASPTGEVYCYLANMIIENKKAFKKFFNEKNRFGYRPKDFKNADDPDTDDGFFEAYLLGLETLINGGYNENDHNQLFELLTKN